MISFPKIKPILLHPFESEVHGHFFLDNIMRGFHRNLILVAAQLPSQLITIHHNTTTTHLFLPPLLQPHPHPFPVLFKRSPLNEKWRHAIDLEKNKGLACGVSKWRVYPPPTTEHVRFTPSPHIRYWQLPHTRSTPTHSNSEDNALKTSTDIKDHITLYGLIIPPHWYLIITIAKRVTVCSKARDIPRFPMTPPSDRLSSTQPFIIYNIDI